ncbi:MAG: hypothetical protein M1484_00245 [Patescibacteria group bacterium]|nr:hypothetical protein [Patescibacteria group bacterium]MCL5431511.1 hypothetical protein [Patescibacteria group bacterium]
MSVPDVTRHLAYLKEHGDRVLSNDIKKFEIRPEIKNQNAREIAEGRKFSPTEWNSWRTTVRFKIDLIRQRTGQPIREGSDEEQEVFQAVAKFRSLIPEDRLRILDSNKLLARHVMIDLRKYRPSE